MSDECLFCPKPAKKTTWYYEDERVIVCEKPGGGPMIVLKDHTDDATDEQRAYIDGVCTVLFGDHERRVLMNHVEDHWHEHVLSCERMPEIGVEQ